MIIKYTKRDSSTAELTLADEAINLGRSPDADIIVLDKRASRMHASIRLFEGAHYIKDLDSSNGTWVNGDRIDQMHKLAPGDKIRIGKTVLEVGGADVADPDKVSSRAIAIPGAAPTTEDVSREIEGKMEEGKGLKTIMREIVEEVEQPAREPVKTKEAVVEAVENVFTEPEEELGKNTTMEITGLEAAEAAPTEKPSLKPKSAKPSLAGKPKLMSKAKKEASGGGEGESGGDSTDAPKIKLGGEKPAGTKRPTLKLKKPGS